MTMAYAEHRKKSLSTQKSKYAMKKWLKLRILLELYQMGFYTYIFNVIFHFLVLGFLANVLTSFFSVCSSDFRAHHSEFESDFSVYIFVIVILLTNIQRAKKTGVHCSVLVLMTIILTLKKHPWKNKQNIAEKSNGTWIEFISYRKSVLWLKKRVGAQTFWKL